MSGRKSRHENKDLEPEYREVRDMSLKRRLIRREPLPRPSPTRSNNTESRTTRPSTMEQQKSSLILNNSQSAPSIALNTGVSRPYDEVDGSDLGEPPSFDGPPRTTQGKVRRLSMPVIAAKMRSIQDFI